MTGWRQPSICLRMSSWSRWPRPDPSGRAPCTEVNVELPATLLGRRGDRSRSPALRTAVLRLWLLAAIGNMAYLANRRTPDDPAGPDRKRGTNGPPCRGNPPPAAGPAPIRSGPPVALARSTGTA